MKHSPSRGLYAAQVFLIATALATTPWCRAQATVSTNVPAVDRQQPSTDLTRAPGDDDWTQLLGALQPPPAAQGTDQATALSPAQQELQGADQAKVFYTQFPQHPRAKEACKLEAVMLVNAVADGDTQSTGRMEAAVKAVRNDTSFSPFDRAVVAGTYEFSQAAKRIKTPADAQREYEAVSRKLIQEFPNQPQGYISLLTQSMQRDNTLARSMALEVINSTAPEDVKAQARRLVSRFDLIGQSITVLFGPTLKQGGKQGWRTGRPGLVYFWTTGNADSLALGEWLATRQLSPGNTVAVCLDSAAIAGPVADAHKLPGQQVYLSGALSESLGLQLAAFETPLVYLVDAHGQIIDVRALYDLETKLGALGL